MGKNVVMVVEGPDELQHIIDLAKERPNVSAIGVRVKLYSPRFGKWANLRKSSKFGLTTWSFFTASITCESLEDKMQMLHFHMDLKSRNQTLKMRLKKLRVYTKFACLHSDLLNIGGGVGVDYDGSKTSFNLVLTIHLELSTMLSMRLAKSVEESRLSSDRHRE